MAVDPGSPGDGINDIIYIGCVGQGRSDDSGNNFTKIHPGIHADTHAWAFVRQSSPNPSTVYNGNDGGLFSSVDKGSNWVHHNSGVQTALFYNITSKGSDDPYGFEVGAFQDNGVTTRDPSSPPFPEWKGSLGGDGGDVAYDSNYRFLYASNWGGGTWVNRSTDYGLTFNKDITPWDRY